MSSSDVVREVQSTEDYKASAKQKAAAKLSRIPVKVQAVLGVARLTVSHLAELERGGVIELDRKIGEPVDVLVNGHPVGRGEIVVVDDPTPHFAVRITDVFSRNTVG